MMMTERLATAALQVELGEQELVIVRTIQAARAQVFAAWVEPERLARWWGPEHFSVPVCEGVASSGSPYRIVMRSPEGVDYPITGVYREVVCNERLVLSQRLDEHPAEWRAELEKGGAGPLTEIELTVLFEDQGAAATRLTIRQRFSRPAHRDAILKTGAVTGWGQSLDKLETLLRLP